MDAMPDALDPLWQDWCAVRGLDPTHLDDETLHRFCSEASPSRKLVARLRRSGAEPQAHAWPRSDRTLALLLRQGSARVDDPGTHWIHRLRLRRMMFAGVLIAPIDQGGLAMTREEIHRLDPAGFQKLRPRIGVGETRGSCPACATWSWLEVLGTNSSWQHSSVRAMAHRVDEGETHRHNHPDPSPEWADWQNTPNLLPAIDRWGYVDRYASLHRSSMSGLIESITWMLDVPLPDPVSRAPEIAVRSARRQVTAEEEREILARADEQNARISALLAEFE